jgi:hypothetical protein
MLLMLRVGSRWKVQLFAYNKISRQPAFQDGDTTAPIFYVSSWNGDGELQWIVGTYLGDVVHVWHFGGCLDGTQGMQCTSMRILIAAPSCDDVKMVRNKSSWRACFRFPHRHRRRV